VQCPDREQYECLPFFGKALRDTVSADIDARRSLADYAVNALTCTGTGR
jgi:hypothetical protein